MASLSTFIASEASLVQEAALAVPHSFDKCTHSQGPIRQAIHLCLSCDMPRGLCSACSVACHGDHEQIELFPKRSFVCDCPIRVGDRGCTLHKGAVAGNEGNTYGQNFEAKFCRCHRPYDAKHERETMVQCLVCEDWYHESCLNLRTRPSERPTSPGPSAQEADDADGGETNASNDLPQPLLPSSSYDTLICGACVLTNETLRRWAGTKGVMMIVRKEGVDEGKPIEEGGVDPRWEVLDEEADAVNIAAMESQQKRCREEDADSAAEERTAKKLRTARGSPIPTASAVSLVPPLEPSPPCLIPPANPAAQRIIEAVDTWSSSPVTGSKANKLLGHADIFLTKGWRERWCRCPKCLSSLERHPYLLEAEETYEPPEDPDSGMSLEDLGMRALLNLPRDRAIDGIRAYNAMRDELISYLRPFAQEGRVVREEDVREFFETKSQAAKG